MMPATPAATTRPLHDPSRIAPEALGKMISNHGDTLDRVARVVADKPLVVLGMAQNPYVKEARKALTEAGLAFEYLEFGSYFSSWRERLAIKLWSGWPTFPQVFVRGVLVGGADLTKAALADGSLKKQLDAS